jgi:hypothetical protein
MGIFGGRMEYIEPLAEARLDFGLEEDRGGLLVVVAVRDVRLEEGRLRSGSRGIHRTCADIVLQNPCVDHGER